MDYREALQYIDGVSWLGSRPGLERVAALLHRLGDPQEKLRFVHIAGTNGKGSCAAMTASVLRAAGYRTGLFTSPYLFRFNERMQINGEPIGDEELAALVTQIRPIADAMEDHPTEFELMTAVALLWYLRERCEIVVLEVGLGGRLDATNVIGAPEAAVIMNIGLDHTAVLGDTVEQIAAEKAGIVKPGCAVALYPQTPEAEAVVRERCEAVGASLRVADLTQLQGEFDSLEGQVFRYRGASYAIPLLGEHQLRNAAVVLEVAEILREKGWKLPHEAVEHGLYAVSWPARFELLRAEPPFVVDGGHNPQCAMTVAESLLRYFPDRRRVLLVGVLADKDYEGLFDILDVAADAYFCVTPASARALPADRLAAFLSRYGKPVTVCPDIPAGVEAASAAAGEDGVACAVGSLYMAGAVRACFGLY
ncbi:MAG: bifunctional folylpolyglutamate synthase/dihydrofolate synthase [Oscillospiraceae bacterium]|jgi:folylpolyglutamate synthase/dihydrofolate synthase|nr:bifunctional folylpolyglutamate synthase/dihydrofolate synthase [Oscillospiraceae bacterium]